MLTVGDMFPEFHPTARASLESGKEFEQMHHKAGRNLEKVLRVLGALRADELCLCNRTGGEDPSARSSCRRVSETDGPR